MLAVARREIEAEDNQRTASIPPNDTMSTSVSVYPQQPAMLPPLFTCDERIEPGMDEYHTRITSSVFGVVGEQIVLWPLRHGSQTTGYR